jgi:ubiquinone/menaquinone biosynthesis C-methylase UbiE
VADGVSGRAGNLVDKYATPNPAARMLVGRWRAALRELLVEAAPESVLDVGCGEGELTAEWAAALPGTGMLGVDVEDVTRVSPAPNLAFRVIAPAPPLPFDDDAFDLVAAVESLEHMEDSEGALAEMARCARRHVLVSAPREPLWRVLNLVRGAYVRRLGDTPGHLRHFSTGNLRGLLRRHGAVVAQRSPLPWSVALVRLYS